MKKTAARKGGIPALYGFGFKGYPIAKEIDDPRDGHKAGTALHGKRLVEGSPGNPGGLRRAGHCPSRSDNVRKSNGEEVVVAFFQYGIKVFFHVLFGFQVVDNVKFLCFKHL
jgi:hypothetical protein